MTNARIYALLLVYTFILCAATPLPAHTELLKLEAVASYYGAEFDGRPTSSGELFNMNDLTAAHKTLPFGTMLEVTNLENGKKVIVRVNDRGPFVQTRELDVSKAAAEILGMIKTGTARVSIRKISGSASVPAETADSRATAGTEASSAVSATTASTVAVAAAPAPVKPAVVPITGGLTAGTAPTSELWRIQLGSFSLEDNATRFVVNLRKDGFNPAFEKNSGMFRVVLTGIKSAELARIKDNLAKAGYSGYLVRQESW